VRYASTAAFRRAVETRLCRRGDGLRWIVDHKSRGSGERLLRLDPGFRSWNSRVYLWDGLGLRRRELVGGARRDRQAVGLGNSRAPLAGARGALGAGNGLPGCAGDCYLIVFGWFASSLPGVEVVSSPSPSS